MLYSSAGVDTSAHVMNSAVVANNPSPTAPGKQLPRLRIVHYLPLIRLADGGVVAAVLDWCTVMASRGHEVVMVTWDSPDAPKDWDGSNGKPKVVWVPPAASRNRKLPNEAMRIWKEQLLSGSVAHLHTLWMYSNIQFAAICREVGVPYIVSIHGMLDDWSMKQRGMKKRLFLAMGGRRYLTAAAAVQDTCLGERDQALQWLPKANHVVVPTLIDLDAYKQLPGPELARSRFGVSADVPLLLFVSRIHPKKGVDILIEAAGKLAAGGRKFQLVIAGAAGATERDYEEGLRRQIQRLGLSDRVQMTGLVTLAEKLSLQDAADLFVLPTFQENFGMVLVEAMAAGTPVVTTRGADYWQEIQAAGGTICENTADAFAKTVNRLLSDPAALAEAGRRGREWVSQTLNKETLTVNFEQMYSQVLAAGPSASAERR
jgi:glycosyltransferase involved in cell wall biosynthesis